MTSSNQLKLVVSYECPYTFEDGTRCCDGSLEKEHNFCKYLIELAFYIRIASGRFNILKVKEVIGNSSPQ